MFEYFETKKIVTDEEFKNILRMACDNFVKINNINLSDLNNHTSLELRTFYTRLSRSVGWAGAHEQPRAKQ